MMVNSAESCLSIGPRRDGYVVGGRAGPVETRNDRSHSLFIGVISYPAPRYAGAVVLEEGSGGLTSAAAIGRDILVAAIGRYPEQLTSGPLETAYVRSQFRGDWVGKEPEIW